MTESHKLHNSRNQRTLMAPQCIIEQENCSYRMRLRGSDPKSTTRIGRLTDLTRTTVMVKRTSVHVMYYGTDDSLSTSMD